MPICTSAPRAFGEHSGALRHPKANEGARHIFRQKIATYEAAARTIFYIDESGFANDMPRTYRQTASWLWTTLLSTSGRTAEKPSGEKPNAPSTTSSRNMLFESVYRG
jgi:hypothetical protein